MSGTQGYAAKAAQLAAEYERITFEDVHRDTMHLFPPPPARVLDIGAGTGRDAAALAKRSYDVIAAEPVAEMRAEGQRIHAAQPITWVDDGLPELAKLRAHGAAFDLILLTAVWMHLDEAEREIGMAALRALVAPSSGRIVMTLRHGPVPSGRRMFDVGFEETERLAKRHDLECLFHGTREDMLWRHDVRWTLIALGAGRQLG